jgi:hypothetical protein
MDVSTTRDQRVDTQPGGGGCLSSLFSGLGSHGSLESIVFLDFQTEGKFFRQHLNYRQSPAKSVVELHTMKAYAP